LSLDRDNDHFLSGGSFGDASLKEKAPLVEDDVLLCSAGSDDHPKLGFVFPVFGEKFFGRQRKVDIRNFVSAA